MELRETKLQISGEDGYSNFAFEGEDIKDQSGSGRSSLRNRNEYNGDSIHTQQGEEHLTIEQDFPKQKRSMEESELTYMKGYLEKKYDATCDFFRKHKIVVQYIIYGILLAGYLALVIAACVVNFYRALPLFVLTVVAISFVIWDYLIAKYEDQIARFLSPGGKVLNKHWFWLKWLMWILLIIAVICWLIFDTAKQGTQPLVSFGGLVLYVLLMFIFSKHPTKVSTKEIFTFILISYQIMFEVFNVDHCSLRRISVLPIVVFFSTVISMLYYIGFMQWLIRKVGWLMQVTLGSSPIESVVAAGNIFVGQTESPLLVRPYLSHLTKSELHAIMTAGFSTIAGSVLGAYISFGVSASHLLTASVMSAPASLATAKLFWPETEIPKITLKSALKMEKGDSRNLLEAASHGASSSISLVANITVNMIAFLALLAFVDSALSWLGNMFDYPQLSFEVICSYVFMPFSFMMGVDWEDSFMVGGLIGYKTFFNEFVAFQQLAKMIKLRKLAGPKFIDGVQQYISVRSETIATYALCGFANLVSLGVVIGGLTSMAPSRKGDIAGGAFRALVAGNVASFMTACIAGILSSLPMEIDCYSLLENAFNSSSPSNTTELVTCCQNLFTSTVAKNYSDILPGSLSTLNNCCLMLNSTTFNCDWVTTSF
ncbi:solute carrier family 28 member 3 [Gracilinanus agilis]|uniref:solute carrier family 28 member 3 n=1 Tax=Gracilinanus agilis TaxID=191870 RepID=UPI001CFE67A2|nr:solute carrier family 28 member 3 [Gracilinanus agilis]